MPAVGRRGTAESSPVVDLSACLRWANAVDDDDLLPAVQRLHRSVPAFEPTSMEEKVAAKKRTA